MKSNLEISALAPFLLEPLFVERIWGTADLRPWYNHVTSEGSGRYPIGEVWLTGGDCRVLTGPLTGQTLDEVFAEYPRKMLGASYEPGMADTTPSISQQSISPVLLKVLFAKEKLSVQVHPDDHMAQKYGELRGKTECWYALAAEPGAQVAAGLRPGVTLADVERGVTDGTLEEFLDLLPVAAGDMVYVDAGTVHAIWPGSVILETQQNSDVTYRLYDYGRPRELHVAKALEAIRLEAAAGKVSPVELADRTILVDREYFCVEKINVEGVRSGRSMIRLSPRSTVRPPDSQGSPAELAEENPSGLAYLFAAAGTGRVMAADDKEFEEVVLPTRGVIAVPAASPEWKIEDLGGLDLIRITPQKPAAATKQSTGRAA
jgi:mannose-6-phosphate isomerase